MEKFSFYMPPIREVKYVKEADLYGIYRYITDPKYARVQTETLRAIQNEEEKKRYKAGHFAYCLFSGRFGTNRKNDGLEEHSGLICFDFDKLHAGSDPTCYPYTMGSDPACYPYGRTKGSDPVSDPVCSCKQMLLNDPNFETLLLFRSPSGDGLKWVIEIDLKKATHEQWYIGISNYLRTTYDLVADPACKNVARACFLPYDPNCYLAPRLHRELVEVCKEQEQVIELMTLLKGSEIQIMKNE